MSIGIYGKKFIFFLAVFIIFGLIIYFVSNQFSSASINEVSNPVGSNQYTINIDIKENSKVYIENQSYPGLMHIENEYDEFRYIAASKEGSYIDNLTIYVHLPKPVNENDIKQNVYAIRGIESYDYFIKDPQTLVYQAQSVSPFSTFTIVAQLPKGLIKFPIFQSLIHSLSNIPPLIWIIISLTLPLITLILLFWLFYQKIADWRTPKPKEELHTPPSNLSLGELEILMHGKISSRTIAATFLNLAQRNFIHIVQREDDFSFGKNRLYNPKTNTLTNELSKPEQYLVSKIFTKENLKSNKEDILMRIGSHIFSKKIANVYIAFYDQVAKRGYFIDNPKQFHRKYYLIGLGLFFLALIMFIFGIWVAPDPKFVLIFWFMMMVSSLLIVRMAPQLPLRTTLGRQEHLKWLQFKNFLTNPQQISYEEGLQDIFEKYLPYAIVMGCEVEWAKRFLDRPFKLPGWYTSEKPIFVLEDFMASLFPIIGFISRSLVASKEPIVH